MLRCLLALAFVSAALLPVACGGDAQCLAAPVCESGETEVDSCDGQPGCRTVETCGVSIGCVSTANCLAEPSCGDDARQVSECPAGVSCETVTVCGSSILCAPDACTSNSVCLATEFCSFPDGQCGRAEPGRCTPRPVGCGDGPLVCLCDGSVTDLGCPGLEGSDVDAGGACTLEAEQFACGANVCQAGANYCQIVTDDTGGLPYTSCGFLPQGCSECSCLTAEIEACNGTCVDGAFPTVTCPGG